jgi:hypothetical protein
MSASAGLTQEVGLGLIVIYSPSIVHGNRYVRQVTGMHRWFCKVLADTVELCLTPLASNGRLSERKGQYKQQQSGYSDSLNARFSCKKVHTFACFERK